jgi:hypothetical protein
VKGSLETVNLAVQRGGLQIQALAGDEIGLRDPVLPERKSGLNGHSVRRRIVCASWGSARSISISRLPFTGQGAVEAGCAAGDPWTRPCVRSSALSRHTSRASSAATSFPTSALCFASSCRCWKKHPAFA